MRNILLFIPILLICTMAAAQKTSVAVGCRPESGKLIVQVKFLFPDKVVSDRSINIFRKAATGNWEKINTKPVTKAALNETHADEDYQNYIAFMKRTPEANPEDENNAQAMVGIMILDNNNLARYAGCYYEDATATAGATYQYRITDALAGDKELAVSGAFTVKENYLPAVTKVTASQRSQDVLLDWEKGSAFLSYNVYRKTTADGKGTRINEDGIIPGTISGKDLKKIGTVKHVDSSLATGAVLYYEITGIDVLGNESQPSPAIKVEIKDMVAPDAVNTLKAEKVKGNTVLTWKVSSSNDLKGYNIYRNSAADTVYRKITTTLLAAGTATYTDNSLKEGDVYGYKVESVDAADNSTKSRPVKVFFPDQTPPVKPTGLKAVTRPGIVQLTWDKNKEADLKGYYIFRASNRNKAYFNKLYKETISGNSFTDTLPGVAKNEFVYYIQPVDKSYNTGTPSDTVIATLPDTAAPHEPVITALEYRSGKVTIEWQARDDDATSFDIYRSQDSVNASYRKVNAAPVTGESYSDNVTEKGRSYHYYVVARDAAGNTSPKSLKRSIYVDVDSPAVVAAADINASYNSRDTAVTISWKNASGDVRGCIVYRKESEDERFSAVSAVVTQNSFTDKDVEPGKTYQYMIRSLYTVGNTYADSREARVGTN